MSGLFRPRNVLIAVAVTAGIVFFPRSMAPSKSIPNIFETPGTKAIGDRYSAGGGANTHQTAVATPRGKSDQVVAPQERPKGINTPHFQENQAAQKPGEPSVAEALYSQAHYGSNNTKGK